MDRRHNPFACIALVLGALLVLAPLGMQTALAQDKPGKVSHDLTRLYEDQAGKRAAPAQLQNLDLEPLSLPVRGDKVLIDAVAAGDLADLEADLEALGMDGTGAFGRICSGWLPIDAIDDLENLASLQSARPAYRANNASRTRGRDDAARSTVLLDDDDDDGGGSDPRGSTFSGGDPAMRSDLARDEFNVDGSGIIVGALSDTYDDAGIALATDAADDVASGDLPPGVIVLDDTGGPGIDEGRAMLQLIHDVAPGAGLAFHTAFNGQADFALGIQELAGCPPGSAPGCVAPSDSADVVVDDVIYFAEPMFQDGIIAQAVDVVEAAGNAYFSSAGNGARRSYENPFAADGTFAFGAFPPLTSFAPPFFGGVAHDFGGGDFCQSITLPGGATVILSFQWSESFFSVTGSLFSGSTLADYDVYLMLEGPGGLPVGVVNGGVDDNVFVTGDAVEITGVSLGAGPPLGLCVMLVQFSKLGDDGVIGASGIDLLKYVRFGSSSVTVNEFDTQSSTNYGHSNAAGAEAVGAARYTETPVFGVDPPLLEFFSAAGGTPILFETDGTPKASAEVRLKPGVTGPDGGNTTFFFPTSTDLEGDGFPNFFGTSASAPHVAGVAALLLEDCANDDDCGEGDDDDSFAAKSADDDDDDGGGGGTLTPAQIYDLLRSTAIDMDDPATPGFDAGFDFGSGFGFVDACNALSDDDDDDGDACEADDDDDDGALYRGIASSAPTTEWTTKTVLLDNYPEPFNPVTTLAIELPETKAVRLHVYDIVGRRIDTLIDGVLPAGRHEVVWEARNLPTGVYFYQLVTDDFVQVKQMMLVK